MDANIINAAIKRSYKLEREHKLVTDDPTTLTRNPLIHIAHKITCRVPINVSQDMMVLMLTDAMHNAALDTNAEPNRHIHIGGDTNSQQWDVKLVNSSYWLCTRIVYIVIQQHPSRAECIIHNGHDAKMDLVQTACVLKICADEDKLWFSRVGKSAHGDLTTD